MKRFPVLCLLLLLGTNLVNSRQGQTPAPRQIVDKMLSVYASCRSYADEGEVKTTIFQERGPHTSTKPFWTAFVRPSRFRFEFQDRGYRGQGDNRYIVWQDQAWIKSWWTIRPETKTFESLTMALSGAQGVSGGSALNVPSMLMSDLEGTQRISTMTELELKGEERVFGKLSYQIEGRDWRNNLLTIFIDKESFLLVRIFEKRKLNDVESESTTTYRPRVNQDISADKLAFNH